MADYSKRKQSEEEPNADEAIKLQAVTQDGVLHVINHNNHLQYPPTNPVANEYLDIDTVPPTAVEKLAKIDDDIAWKASIKQFAKAISGARLRFFSNALTQISFDWLLSWLMGKPGWRLYWSNTLKTPNRWAIWNQSPKTNWINGRTKCGTQYPTFTRKIWSGETQRHVMY